jgi:hypothetical protein
MGGSSNDAGHMSMGGMLNKGVIGDIVPSEVHTTGETHYRHHWGSHLQNLLMSSLSRVSCLCLVNCLCPIIGLAGTLHLGFLTGRFLKKKNIFYNYNYT